MRRVDCGGGVGGEVGEGGGMQFGQGTCTIQPNLRRLIIIRRDCVFGCTGHMIVIRRRDEILIRCSRRTHCLLRIMVLVCVGLEYMTGDKGKYLSD